MIGADLDAPAAHEAFAEAAADLRSRALAVDRDPDDLEPHLDSFGIRMVREATTPLRYRTGSEPMPYGPDTCRARVAATVELARGDAALLTASPGPSLAGVVVDALGSEAQRDLFYEAIADSHGWTFFAMTEPDLGSDATTMRSSLERDADGGYRLHGVKRYISNGTRGRIGVVFARTGPSPLAIRAVMVRCPADGCERRALDMVGLRGARISELEFDGVHVPDEAVLGGHLRTSQRGLWGAMRTFNYMRVHIGAMAVGTAIALAEYVDEHRPGLAETEVFSARLAAARRLLNDAAESVDHRPQDPGPPSLAKLHGTALAVEVARWAGTALGAAALLEHPLLEKWSRDVPAFEFMDGTSNIQRLQVVRDL